MPLVTTPAVVLQTYRYSETSKVVRLATRDLGIQSAIAKGALRPKSRFGAGLELLSEGTAQLYFRETRELHTLGAFDLTNLRRELAADVGRFTGAAALAEVMLKMAPPAPLPAAYDALLAALDALTAAPAGRTDATAVRALWRLVAVLGFEPSLTACVRDGTAIDARGEAVLFSIAEGGAFCPRCAPVAASSQPSTRLPAQAYRDLVALNNLQVDLPNLDAAHTAAHRRLVARFVRYHLGEAGSLSALDVWERRAWPSPNPTPLPSAVS
jgi:DNA repair protein RecO (recombination protein O)